MRFASCTGEIEISGIRKCFEGAGPDAINLGLGQPDFDTPNHIKEAAIESIYEGFTGYTPNCGIPELRTALAEKFQLENNITCTPDEIMVTSGASEGLFLAISATVDKGDEVLIGDPGFLSYNALTKLAGGKAMGVPLNDHLTLSAETLNDNITDKTKAIVLNSPANPTGAVQTRDEIKAIVELADENDLTIISDEVYEHFIYEGEHVSPGQFSDNVITINGVSKTYAMTGWRVGYLVAKGCALEQLLKIHQYVQACACSISQKAAYRAITGPQECVAQMKDEFKKRRDILVTRLREMDLDLNVPQGAFYLFPRVGNGDEIASSLAKAGVIVVPGSAFGLNGKDHIRISYAASQQKLEEALRRMKGIL
ncbi:MAG: pyridoxal phosphate-dependent aminotransferase [Methanotrichaceae archaeon]|nr:pyridoxal phosphate-dependent aminotransferase [Methanotrichaceae archaeon]